MTQNKPRFLTLKQNVELANFMTQCYSASKLDNARFAEHASQKLGFAVSQPQVLRCRVEMGLAPNKPRRLEQKPEKGTMMARIERLEREMQQLKTALGEK